MKKPWSVINTLAQLIMELTSQEQGWKEESGGKVSSGEETEVNGLANLYNSHSFKA